jgi:hypothetical protein
MALPFDSTIAIVAVGTAVLAIVVYLELRYMKSRRKNKVDVVLVQDDAYNAMMTTQAVSEALKGQGRNTREADQLLVKAKAAYQRREYLMCKELAEEARSILRQCKTEAKMDSPEELSSSPVEEPVTEQNPPLKDIKKLPQNYLESKFMIETARMCIDTASKEGVDIAEAEKTLTTAKDCYGRTEYTEALKNALKAKKIAEGQNIASQTEPTRAPESRIDEPKELSKKSVRSQCGSCHQPVDENDSFCRKCGAKIVRVPKCPSCAFEVDSADAFCRKCGAKIG